MKKEEKELKKTEKTKEKKSKKEVKSIFTTKNIILAVSSLIVLMIVVAIVITVATPSMKYNKANKKFEEGNYEEAIKIYKDLDDYKDSSAKVKETYYEYGKKLIKDGKYEEAIKKLEKAKGKDRDKYSQYATALKNIEDKQYDEGIKIFKELSDFENSKEDLRNAYYLKAEQFFKEGKYTDAKTNYEETEEYKDSKTKIELCNFMNAEAKYKEGDLVTAQKLFKELPAELEVDGVKVSERLDTLKEYSAFVNLMGSWKGTNGKMSVREIWNYNGEWDEWYNSYTNYLTIEKCVINEDGSVKVSGTAKFYTYTNYSSLSYLLKDKNVEVPFTVTVKKGGSLPKSITKYPAMIAANGTVGYATVTYENNKFKLSFELNDKNYSQNFRQLYKSSITYSK